MGVCWSKFEVLEGGFCEDHPAEGVFQHEEEAGGVRQITARRSYGHLFVHTQQGGKGVNQDAMAVWEAFAGEQDQIFCGVFDGHGPVGHKVARHVSVALPSKLSLMRPRSSCHKMDDSERSSINSSRGLNGSSNSMAASASDCDQLIPAWENVIVQAFEDLDRDLGNHSEINCFCSGTTAVSVIKKGDHLIIANLGDSRAVLCTRDDKNQPVAVQLTTDLKPNLPGEAERIKRCRGRVFSLDEEPDVHRLWLPDQNAPGLAMARSFGDFCLKDFGLIATPEVSYRKLSAKDEFVVLATDGVWDVLSNEEVVKIVSSEADQPDAAKRLVNRTVRAWRRKFPTSNIDDCAVICLFLRPHTLNAVTASANNTTVATLNVTSTTGTRSGMAQSGEEQWAALGGVSRSNSLLQLPRLAAALSWHKKVLRTDEEQG